jgi:hypothetical protein
MLITKRSDIKPGEFIYFINNSGSHVTKFYVVSVGRKFVYGENRKSVLHLTELLGNSFTTSEEAATLADRMSIVRSVRKIFTWSYNNLLTDDECIELYKKYGDKLDR